MALNKYMHPRNPYRHKKPNFRQLAEKYSFFKEIAQEDENGRVTVDFKMPSHLAALSKALLLEDFDISVELPLDRLVPTVPLRLNYILWLEDIAKSFVRSSSPVRVLDVGVGASCIYPLLGAKKNSWNFVGTETDQRNLTFAKENVTRNGLQNLIKLIHVKEEESSVDAAFTLMDAQQASSPFYLDLVMANPPFFCDTSDAIGTTTSRSITRPEARTVSSAARQESQTRGGEVYYCMRIARDSVKYATRVGVFTVMLGKKSSVVPMKRILRKLKIPRASVYELCQGRIMRWGLAWTFLPGVEFPQSEFRRLRKSERPPLSLVLPATVSCLPKYTVDELLCWLRNEFKQLKMRVLDQKNRAELGGIHLSITASENTWTHSRRKRREAQRSTLNSTNSNAPMEQELLRPPTPSSNTTDSSVNGICSLFVGSKRAHPESENTTYLGPGVPMLPETPDISDAHADETKRARVVDEACDEADAWYEEVPQIPTEQYEECPVAKAEPVIQADVFVEQHADDTKHSDTSDADADDDQNLLSSSLSGPLVIKIAWVSGTCREAANQILCYLKNRLR
ncbi:methyltransferase protein 16 [Fasciola hepatica]|uniref:U6 small nuclear RNA (adenine-(43)-N(6))-methyltransferase n=1 Tax=Fasciola hepatica TaxID=6192 RepID=A0A4E0R2R3_FASHE|nr:methyltransferase protein 16 [Fasciola hepatica]